MACMSGFVTPVPDEKREAYVASAKAAWELFLHPEGRDAWRVDQR